MSKKFTRKIQRGTPPPAKPVKIREGKRTRIKISGEEFVRALADAHGLEPEESR